MSENRKAGGSFLLAVLLTSTTLMEVFSILKFYGHIDLEWIWILAIVWIPAMLFGVLSQVVFTLYLLLEMIKAARKPR